MGWHHNDEMDGTGISAEQYRVRVGSFNNVLQTILWLILTPTLLIKTNTVLKSYID